MVCREHTETAISLLETAGWFDRLNNGILEQKPVFDKCKTNWFSNN
jgi:hypothetical protein